MAIAEVTTIAPSRSMPWSRPMPGRSTTSACTASAASAPIGTLTKKIQCQSMAWVSAPPASRPIDPPATETNV
jgi:hypothetical protein